jgi:DNA-binding NarL/FixJ family response regulator
VETLTRIDEGAFGIGHNPAADSAGSARLQPLSLAIVEDEPQTRAALAARLGAVDGYRIVWQADRLASARVALRECAPQVLIVDLGLPDGSGLDLIEEVRGAAPATAIMVLTVFGDEHKLIRAIERGARGYLLKDEPAIGLVDAIEQLRAGGAPISPAIARHLVARMLQPAPALPAPAPESVLTSREIEVLRLSAKGYNHAEVARLLDLSTHTVASYTRRIYEKLEVNSRSEAVFEASRLGLLHAREG